MGVGREIKTILAFSQLFGIYTMFPHVYSFAALNFTICG
jgi:hypothetical protein